MFEKALFIRPENDAVSCPVFRRTFTLGELPAEATLAVTGSGVYEAFCNEKRIGDICMAPGWTAYEKRLQYQVYDISPLLKTGENEIQIILAPGWRRSRLGWRYTAEQLAAFPAALIGEMQFTFADRRETVVTDRSWQAADSRYTECTIYDGVQYDARKEPDFSPAVEIDLPKDVFIPQENEPVRMQEQFSPEVIVTPRHEVVLDFKQEITGTVKLDFSARSGEVLQLSCAEILDGDGNFYNENYRSAKSLIRYVCRDGRQTFCPTMTFFGFRYLRIDLAPEGFVPESVTAVVLHSDFKKTASFECGVPLVNRLYQNVVWGQKSNMLDIPTDCPQRDERLGWTGDAAAFVRTACYNFDMQKFFAKWLHDLAAEQFSDGSIPPVIPNASGSDIGGAGWSDAACICPWAVYTAYGNKKILQDQFESMQKYVDCIARQADDRLHWIGGSLFGDWLQPEAPFENMKGTSDLDVIATAFFAHSTDLLVHAGKVLGKDVSKYEALFKKIRRNFTEDYLPKLSTQTELSLAVCFDLCDDKKAVSDRLADLVRQDGDKLQTGFIGTPHLLHALSAGGHDDLCYTLLLRTEYPSWLYPVTKGATTIWEHWDGIKPDGQIWQPEMNSYNHYAYGAVADWLFMRAAGICIDVDESGNRTLRIEPHPDKRLGHLDVDFSCDLGHVRVHWHYEGDRPIVKIEQDYG